MNGRADVVVLDMFMPNIDGLETVVAMRKASRGVDYRGVRRVGPTRRHQVCPRYGGDLMDDGTNPDQIEREHDRRNLEQLQWLRAKLKQLQDNRASKHPESPPT
jgi:PleD family two-component response regulator